jgi:hypothetical protein
LPGAGPDLEDEELAAREGESSVSLSLKRSVKPRSENPLSPLFPPQAAPVSLPALGSILVCRSAGSLFPLELCRRPKQEEDDAQLALTLNRCFEDATGRFTSKTKATTTLLAARAPRR